MGTCFSCNTSWNSRLELTILLNWIGQENFWIEYSIELNWSRIIWIEYFFELNPDNFLLNRKLNWIVFERNSIIDWIVKLYLPGLWEVAPTAEDCADGQFNWLGFLLWLNTDLFLCGAVGVEFDNFSQILHFFLTNLTIFWLIQQKKIIFFNFLQFWQLLAIIEIILN